MPFWSHKPVLVHRGSISARLIYGVMDRGELNATNYTHGANPKKKRCKCSLKEWFAAGKGSSSSGKRLEGEGSQHKDADACQRMSWRAAKGETKGTSPPGECAFWQQPVPGEIRWFAKMCRESQTFCVFGMWNYSMIRPYA